MNPISETIDQNVLPRLYKVQKLKEQKPNTKKIYDYMRAELGNVRYTRSLTQRKIGQYTGLTRKQVRNGIDKLIKGKIIEKWSVTYRNRENTRWERKTYYRITI